MTESSDDTPKAIATSLKSLLSTTEPDPEPIEVVAGEPFRRYAGFVDEGLEAGAWKATTGRWTESPQATPEVAYITRGRIRLHPTEGDPVDVFAGDLLYVPVGWSGTWEILEDVEKVYVVLPE